MQPARGRCAARASAPVCCSKPYRSAPIRSRSSTQWLAQSFATPLAHLFGLPGKFGAQHGPRDPQLPMNRGPDAGGWPLPVAFAAWCSRGSRGLSGTLNAYGACRDRDGPRSTGRGALRARPACGATRPTWQRTPPASRLAPADKQLRFPSWQSLLATPPHIEVYILGDLRAPASALSLLAARAFRPHGAGWEAVGAVFSSSRPDHCRARPLR